MKVLHIDCSPRAESYSREISAEIVARLLMNDSDPTIIRRDLGKHPIPHIEAEYAAAMASPKTMATDLSHESTRLSEQLIQEVERADVLVIGTPMNNFTVPSVLKAWVDQVLRVGRTIGTSAAGKKIGLLQDRPVYIGIASGGVFTGDNAKQPDFLIPYLTAALGCIGLHSLHFFPLQATAFLDPGQLENSRKALFATMNAVQINAQ